LKDDLKFPADQHVRARTLDTQQSFLVQAPAGSGKTELLIRRLLKLLAEVDEPEEILAITFTIAATAEMRARVLKALHDAENSASPDRDAELAGLASAALANDKARGWNLLQQPQRLSILTIDAVCLTIAHETPLLSRLGGSLSPTDKPQPLYTLAARRTLARLGDQPELSNALRALLQLRATSLLDCENLIAGMLDKRDQWGRVLPLGDARFEWPAVRDLLEQPLRRLHQQTIKKAQSLFARHPELEPELAHLLAHACGNLDADADLMMLKDVVHLRHLTGHQHWKCLADFLLTKSGTWRKKAPPGFVSGKPGQAARDQYASFIQKLDERAGLLEILHELRRLPPQAYTEEESQMLQHLLVILRYAVASLLVVFAEHGVVDFVQLGLAAREVLSDEEGKSSELAAEVAGRWRHLLVDEFQDTSRSQYELLTLLAGGWESGDRGTCFLVGDPMQSIYMFRQAEVELFERTLRHGLGEGTSAVQLAPLKLQTNFRSHAGLVDRLNEIFRQVFAPRPGEDSLDYHVAFAPSTASRPAKHKTPSVHVWPFFRSSKPSPEEKQAGAEAEAKRVISIIQEHLPKVEESRRENRKYRIAVLVRARSHLALITPRLRKQDIPFRAIEIEQLGERQEVQDLAALTRALLHPMDRIAWLTVLRAPWCGLTLKDLHILCGNDSKEYATRPVLTLLRERAGMLSEDGQRRAARVHAVLEDALRGKHRQVSLARWVERTWTTLGGNACVDRTGFANVRAFFAMLEDLGPDAGGLDERLTELCAQPDPRVDECRGVQLMTIHKAKGLGFEVVIVPGLDRSTQVETQPLLHWIEQTRLVGAAEEEEREFVVAPIGRNGEPGDIYRWIAKQHARREDEEAKRLLYVATTRASEELHLLGTATLKAPKNGTQELSSGDKHSLLGIAWEALKSEFEKAHQEQPAAEAATPEQAEFDFAPPGKTIPLRRLPVEWKPIESGAGVDILEKNPEIIERPRGSLAARAFGTVVHALLEDVTSLPGVDADGVSPAVLAEVGSWRARALALLRANGLARAEAETESAEVVRALQAVLQDATGRWVLGARSGAKTETSWSGWATTEGGEVVRTLRGDRIFRAGAAPGSAEETHLWIVDYKTARHGASGLDAFLESEKGKYVHQLEAYAEIMRKVHGEDLPIRMALYYPLLSRLVWW
jgi:ATP-dependent helicase/nuclease subunit A